MGVGSDHDALTIGRLRLALQRLSKK